VVYRTRREKYGGAMTVQAATHLLITIIFGVDPQDETLLVEQKWEIDKFLDAVQSASVFAADQGKVLTVQIQYAQPGIVTIQEECGGTYWQRRLSEFAKECGLVQVCQIRFTHIDSVSAVHAHLLESQQYLLSNI